MLRQLLLFINSDSKYKIKSQKWKLPAILTFINKIQNYNSNIQKKNRAIQECSPGSLTYMEIVIEVNEKKATSSGLKIFVER